MIERRQFKETSIFLVFQNLIEMELKEVEDYINEISCELRQKQKKLEKDYENANKKVEEDAEYDVNSFFEDDIHKYFKVFPIYTYNPLLLTLYGQFENWLKKLCDLDSRKGFSKVRVKDLAGNNYIEKSRRYLEIVAEINLDDTKLEWQKITQIQKLRNCIAHNDSNIIKDKSIPIEKQELYKNILNDNRLEFDKIKGDFYIKEPEFLFDTIGLIRKYLAAVIDKIKSRNVVAKNMSMPFDNANWGQEKTENLLKQIISALNQLDENEARTDEYKDSDLKGNLRGIFESMAFNVTKLYSFFTNGKWETIDQKYIIEEREKGLEKIKKLYDIK
ncbi:hypothetical protein [Arsenicibacter rosenii]|uniref:Uncharacterized protein n=1 Tax=Arsenicibacter rosenii TaxID=1750698 RepID=A0A1S2VBW3_9BACT|nr:hypothetical protein [Arsenicibacter rosenii]OIN56231.1 hypothetical protein BLX24_25885 [Arsenicibacter rosenii]